MTDRAEVEQAARDTAATVCGCGVCIELGGDGGNREDPACRAADVYDALMAERERCFEIFIEAYCMTTGEQQDLRESLAL